MKLPLHFLLPRVKGIPVLMYHKVWEGAPDKLTISPRQLRIHLAYLHSIGLRSLGLQEFMEMVQGTKPIDRKSFLLTFDDGYLSHCTLVYPILQAFNYKATFFIVGDSLTRTVISPSGQEQKATAQDLAMLDPEVVQLALHSYCHHHFGTTELAVIKSDLEQNIRVFEQSGLPFFRILAYPYGGRPADSGSRDALKRWMKQKEIRAAFRIGNKPCVLPANDPFELKRIDIWGTDSVDTLAIKLKKGKLKPF